MALQERGLLVGRTGPERRDNFFQPSQRESQDIELSLDENGPLRLAHPVFGEMQVVEQLTLVKDRRLRRIQVLRLSLAEDPPAKGDDAGTQIVNGKQESATESRDFRAIVPFNHEPRFQQHFFAQPQSFHCVEETRAPRPKPESLNLRLLHRDVSRFEVLARDFVFRTLTQLAREPIGGGRDRREQRLTGIRPSRARPLGDRDADPPRDFAHRRGVVHAESLHEVGEDVARFVADEAIEHPLLGNDGEIAMRAAVKWAAPSVVRSSPLQLDALADNPDEIRCVADLLDHVVGNHANSATVTPWPP